jgi:beta-lactamase superfamily II metal-dependent hydrolase
MIRKLVFFLWAAAVVCDVRAGDRTVLTVEFLDVRNGNCVLLRTSDGFTVLVDSGDGTVALSPLLKARNIRRVDVAVITCPLVENIGGFSGLISDSVDIGEFLAPQTSGAPGQYDSLLEEIMMKQENIGGMLSRETRISDAMNDTKHYEFRNIAAGFSFTMGPDVTVAVLGPCKPYRNTRADVRNNSLVLKASYGGQGFLLPGNAGADSQRDLARLDASRLQASVLQIPDGGSGFASVESFLRKTAPKYAVLQPLQGTEVSEPGLDVLKSTAEIQTTDKRGSVRFKTDGIELTVETER